MKTLTNNQQIRVEGFRFQPVITVRTLRAAWDEKDKHFAKEHLGCVTYDEYRERDRMNGGKEFWTYKAGAILTADYPGKAEEMERKRQAYLNAVEIKDGEIVLIDGIKLIVSIAGENYSDPVHFKRVENNIP